MYIYSFAYLIFIFGKFFYILLYCFFIIYIFFCSLFCIVKSLRVCDNPKTNELISSLSFLTILCLVLTNNYTTKCSNWSLSKPNSRWFGLATTKKDIIVNLDFDIPSYKRYVDEILQLIPQDKIQYTLNKFNSLAF